MYLVSGGVSSESGGRQATTEILKEGGAAWQMVGDLPTPLGNLIGATLGNQVYTIGKMKNTTILSMLFTNL